MDVLPDMLLGRGSERVRSSRGCRFRCIGRFIVAAAERLRFCECQQSVAIGPEELLDRNERQFIELSSQKTDLQTKTNKVTCHNRGRQLSAAIIDSLAEH